MSNHFQNVKVEKLPNAEASITGEITLDFLKECRSEALKELNNSVTIPGFRKGHVPEDVLVKNAGEMRILEETAEIALGREYPHILKEAKISPIGRPTVSITKLAPGINLEFKIHVALEPDFSLPDYKKFAADAMNMKQDLVVTDKEVEDVKAEIEKQKMDPKLAEGEVLEEKIKENLMKEKEFRAKEKQRLTIIDSLVKATEIALPAVLVDAELEKMIAQFKDDIARANLKWDDYIKSIKKTEEEVRTEWKPRAEERVKAELILGKIADAEKLEPSVEELERETTHMLEHYPEADPMRVRIYLYSTMRNEKVINFLEGQK